MHIMGNICKDRKVKSGILLLSLGLLLTACESKEEAAENHLKKGIELLEKGDYAAAQLELKTAKQGNSSAAETYYYLALSDEKVKNYLAMKDNLIKTLELNPEHRLARLKLGKVQLLIGNLEAAQEHTNTLLISNPKDLDALALKASILLKQNYQAAALEIVNEILVQNPVHVDGLTLKSMVLLQQKKFPEAVAVIDQAINQSQKNIALHLFKINIHAKQNNIEAMIDDYLALINLFPDNDKIKITLAKVYAQSGKAEEAELLLRDLVAKKQEQLEPKILLLDFLAATNSEKVDGQIQVFISQMTENPGLMLDFSKWLLAKGDLTKAIPLLNKVVAISPDSKIGIAANILLAKLEFDKKEYEATKKIVSTILSKKPDQLDAQLLHARLLLVEQQYEQAQAYLDKVMWTHPKSDEALVLLAQIYLVQGDKQKSQLKFKAALEVNPANIQAFLPIYNRLMADNKLAYARDIVMRGLRKNPRQAVILQKLVQINMLEEKWQEAGKVAVQLAKLPRQQNLAKFYLANIFQGQGEHEKAIVLYKQLMDEFPEQLRVLKNMSNSYAKLNKRSEMVDFLQQHIKNSENNIAATLVLSDLYAENKQYTNAIRLLKKLIAEKPQVVIVKQNLAKIYMDINKLDKAILVYKKGLDILPGNIRLLLGLASAYERQNSFDEAVAIYEQLIIQSPGLQVAANNLAVLLVEQFPTDDNLKRARQLVDNFALTEHPYYQDTYAWTLLYTGEARKALDIFKKMIIKSPDVPVFRYHLAVAEYQNGNNTAAIIQLDQAINLGKSGMFFAESKQAEKLKKEIIAKSGR
jgi:tetratricopeptide (TPR) repeat protein